MGHTLLIVDDEEDILESLRLTFEDDFDVYTARSGADGLALLEDHPPVVIIADQRMPEMSGIEFFQTAKKKYPDPIRILLTGYADINAVIDAINMGEVYRYLTKPWNAEEVKSVIRDGFDLFRLREENRILTERLIKANEQLEFLLRQNLIS